jgi:hypothetical protein
MRSFVLVAAMVLVSASAQAGQSRNLSVAGTSSHPIAAPLPPTPASVIAEAPPATTAAPVAPAPVAAPVPPPLPPAVPAATAAPAAAPAVDAPKYVERPAVAPGTTDTPKVDDGKPSRRAERRHHGGWTAGRIIGELRRYGYGYGYGGW